MQVIIGVDPHKLSATLEVVDDHERLLGQGRFATDKAGYSVMRSYAKAWPVRVWAVEGANGVGRPLAQRLLESGEHVVDVPAKLAARVRLVEPATTARRTRTTRTPSRWSPSAPPACGSCRSTVSWRRCGCSSSDGGFVPPPRPNRRPAAGLLAELLPGQAKKDLTTGQAKRMLATVRPRDIAGRPGAGSPPRSSPSSSRSRRG